MSSLWFQTCLALSYSLAVLAYAGTAHGGVLFSSLQQTIIIEARIESQNTTTGVARAEEDTLIVTWDLNTDLPPSVDDDYEEVSLKLCFSPESQKERGWRKTHDDLHKDKTCQIHICSHPWYSAVGNGSVWKLPKDIPGGTYFVRIYATDRDGKELAYGQTTNPNKTSNLITIDPYSGRNALIDVAAAICSAFSLLSLLFFLALETLQLNRARTSTVNESGGKII